MTLTFGVTSRMVTVTTQPQWVVHCNRLVISHSFRGLKYLREIFLARPIRVPQFSVWGNFDPVNLVRHRSSDPKVAVNASFDVLIDKIRRGLVLERQHLCQRGDGVL